MTIGRRDKRVRFLSRRFTAPRYAGLSISVPEYAIREAEALMASDISFDEFYNAPQVRRIHAVLVHRKGGDSAAIRSAFNLDCISKTLESVMVAAHLTNSLDAAMACWCRDTGLPALE